MQVALRPGNSTETQHTRAKLRVPPPQAVAAHPRLQHLRAAAENPARLEELLPHSWHAKAEICIPIAWQVAQERSRPGKQTLFIY